MSNIELAGNPNTPPETLDLLANDNIWNVRYLVAKNPNTPQYIRTYLKLQRTIGGLSTRS
jgi:hypothetical protein